MVEASTIYITLTSYASSLINKVNGHLHEMTVKMLTLPSARLIYNNAL